MRAFCEVGANVGVMLRSVQKRGIEGVHMQVETNQCSLYSHMLLKYRWKYDILDSSHVRKGSDHGASCWHCIDCMVSTDVSVCYAAATVVFYAPHMHVHVMNI